MNSKQTKPEVFWPYNETFRYFYDVPLAGKRAHAFVEEKNQCKGGHWTLKTSAEYDEWYKAKGQHLEALGKLINYNHHHR